MTLPISPKHQLIFYDKGLYRVGEFLHKSVYLTNNNDIDSLNGLQYLNAHKNLYFNQDVTDTYIRKIVELFPPFLRTVKSNVEEYYGRQNEKGKHPSLVHTFKEDIRCQLSLSFVKPSRQAKSFKLDNRAVYVRDEARVQLLKDFITLVDRGEYKPSEFQKFLRDR